MRKAALHNLGCKVNAYETEAMQQLLEEAGYEIVPFQEKADVYVINTCSVTNIADRKSRQMLHRARKMNPDAVVVAAGCYVQAKEKEIQVDDCIDIVLGNNKKQNLIEALEEYERTHNADCNVTENEKNAKKEKLIEEIKKEKTNNKTESDEKMTEAEKVNKIVKKAKESGITIKKETGLIIKIPDKTYGYCTIPSTIVPALDAETLTKTEIELRSQVHSYAMAFKNYLDGFQDMIISSSGPAVGIREARRIVGDKTLKGEEIIMAPKYEDSIARGGWSPEMHKSNTAIKYTHIPDNEYFSIPLGCLKVKEWY